jgi:hypothetical protein
MKWRKKITAKKLKRAAWQAGYSLGTAAATAAVLYAMLPIWLGVVILAVVVAHEFGHYFSALNLGQNPLLPFFIPLIYGVLGGTTVKGKDPVSLQSVALAGPMVGAIVSVLVMIVGAAIAMTPMVWAAFWMLLFQVWSGTFGADGRRYRRHRNEATEVDFVNTFEAATAAV